MSKHKYDPDIYDPEDECIDGYVHGVCGGNGPLHTDEHVLGACIGCGKRPSKVVDEADGSVTYHWAAS